MTAGSDYTGIRRLTKHVLTFNNHRTFYNTSWSRTGTKSHLPDWE